MMIDWYSVIALVIFVTICIYLIKRGYSNKVKAMMFYLVCKAEIIYGSGTGELKYSQVVLWIYENLPKIMQILFTQKEIDQLVEDAVQAMKTWLTENEKAKVYIESSYGDESK